MEYFQFKVSNPLSEMFKSTCSFIFTFIFIISATQSAEYSKLISETSDSFFKPKISTEKLQAHVNSVKRPESVETVDKGIYSPISDEKGVSMQEVTVGSFNKNPTHLRILTDDVSLSKVPRSRILRGRKVHPGQYAGKF